MKQFTVLLVCCIVGVFSQDTDYLHKADPFRAACITESNAKPELVDKLLKMEELNEDKDLKCFIKCLLVKMTVMTDAGEVKEDGFRSQLPPGLDKAKADAAVQKCKDLKGTDVCDTAFDVVKCTYDVLKA